MDEVQFVPGQKAMPIGSFQVVLFPALYGIQCIDAKSRIFRFGRISPPADKACRFRPIGGVKTDELQETKPPSFRMSALEMAPSRPP